MQFIRQNNFKFSLCPYIYLYVQYNELQEKFWSPDYTQLFVKGNFIILYGTYTKIDCVPVLMQFSTNFKNSGKYRPSFLNLMELNSRLIKFSSDTWKECIDQLLEEFKK